MPSVEARVVENLEDRLVAEQLLDVGRVLLAGGDLHHIGRAVARRKLHHAKPVAPRIEPHRLGVDGDGAFIGREVGKIAAMQANGHQAIRFEGAMPGPRIWAANCII